MGTEGHRKPTQDLGILRAIAGVLGKVSGKAGGGGQMATCGVEVTQGM